MGLFLVPVPLFDQNNIAEAYLFRYRLLSDVASEGEEDDGLGDSIRLSPVLKALQITGIEAFTGGKPLLVPIDNETLLSDPNYQCKQSPDHVVFLLEEEVPVEPRYTAVISHLRSLGFRFAQFSHEKHDEHDVLMRMCDYILLRKRALRHSDRKALLRRYHRQNPKIQIVAQHLDTHREFESLAADEADLFEGAYYYTALPESETKLSPIKSNLIHLLNVVRDMNFEFSTIAQIVQRDPALSVSLMRFVNSPFIGVRNKIRTIHHAVTMLGQEEVRKWVTAAVFKSMATDRPGGLVRLSLIRAKFSENLSGLYGLESQSQSIFLMGLFSLLDIVMNTTMNRALDSVSVSDEIRDALTENGGPYGGILSLVRAYERAGWDEVIGSCAGRHIAPEAVSDAYIQAISWYNALVFDQVRPTKR